MLKVTLIIAATAIPSFAVGFWTESSMGRSPIAVATGAPSTISPAEMHLKIKSDDLPVQYMQADCN
jgi:hypothetical protein